MIRREQPAPDEVEHILRNAQLRDELEPLYDEAISRVNPAVMTTRSENEFLASMLAWERAPILPIRDWFDPPLELPPPETLDDEALHELLWKTIRTLFSHRIVLDFTDHLLDRELYCLVYRDILLSYEKKIDRANNTLHWDCANISDDPDIWLRYYASEAERLNWAFETGEEVPPREEPPHRRRLPRASL